MAIDPGQLPARKPRNIVIFSDGTGQRGGLYFDEERSNVYKLYRATRVSPDSNIVPDRQVAFYDPGLGTLQPGGSTPERIYRYIYNFTSRATGLGITRNIIDCYAAIIRLWQPGDRIFLFGFSRGAYTVRCLASVICYCGVPTTDRNGKPLRRDIGSDARGQIRVSACQLAARREIHRTAQGLGGSFPQEVWIKRERHPGQSKRLSAFRWRLRYRGLALQHRFAHRAVPRLCCVARCASMEPRARIGAASVLVLVRLDFRLDPMRPNCRLCFYPSQIRRSAARVPLLGRHPSHELPAEIL